MVTEFAMEPHAADAPLHVVALRTPKAKYAVYSDFAPGTIKFAGRRETELYDYSSSGGRMELRNDAGSSLLEGKLAAELKRAVRDELRAQLPKRFHAAHKRGFADYFDTAQRAVIKAAERRRRRAEAEGPFGGEGGIGFGGSPTTSARRRANRRRSRRRK
jgi:hypothetical protein